MPKTQVLCIPPREVVKPRIRLLITVLWYFINDIKTVLALPLLFPLIT